MCASSCVLILFTLSSLFMSGVWCRLLPPYGQCEFINKCPLSSKVYVWLILNWLSRLTDYSHLFFFDHDHEYAPLINISYFFFVFFVIEHLIFTIMLVLHVTRLEAMLQLAVFFTIAMKFDVQIEIFLHLYFMTHHYKR